MCRAERVPLRSRRALQGLEYNTTALQSALHHNLGHSENKMD